MWPVLLAFVVTLYHSKWFVELTVVDEDTSCAMDVTYGMFDSPPILSAEKQ